jgi:SNF2 family DNA or RNA helicase
LIRISKKSSGYLVVAFDEEGLKALSVPLHRVFFRGNLGGERQDDNEEWFIPLGDKPADTLQRIIGHFAKYQVGFELDDNSREVLDSIKKAVESYQRILKGGLSAKKHVKKHELKKIQDILSLSFKRKLTELQLHGVYHLFSVHNGANLSVPGSGKTSVVLAYYDILRTRKEVDSILVIGPGSCFEPWETESHACFKKTPKILRLAGKPRDKRRESYLLSTRYQILLTTYHSAARDVEQLSKVLRRRRYLLVLDESHYVKRPQGGILADAVLKLAPFAKYRVILTGTPMPNDLADLWTQFTFLWHDQLPLGTVGSYLQKTQGADKENALSWVRHVINPLFFRVTKHQLALPRPVFHIHKCEMSSLQTRIYRGVATRFLLQANEAPRDREALREWRRARVIRLLQIASNPALLRSSCDEFQLPPLNLEGIPLRDAIEHYASYELPFKIEHTCEIVKSICRQGLKVIVWSTFVHNLIMMAKQLKEMSPVVVHGGIPLASSGADEFDRERLIHKFKTDPKTLVLIANPAACAESISLHKVCKNAIYLDRSFNCAHYLQSLDRIHRLGLAPSDRICYYLLLSKDSVDEIVHSRLREKMRNMRTVTESPLPGELPGYWSNDLGEEEERDFYLVEKHIKNLTKKHVHKA